MITNPADYLKLLINIQESPNYYQTLDETFKEGKNYYKRVLSEDFDPNNRTDIMQELYENEPFYEYVIRNDYTPGESIAEWKTAKISSGYSVAEAAVYETLGLYENAYRERKTVILLPTDESTFEVDLNTRTVNVPHFLSVQTEHNAETIYFKMSRYFENVDLSKLTCVVQYVNANGEGGIYAVPFTDIDTFKGENAMLVPWAIGGKVTAYPGEVTFSIRFYQIDKATKTFNYNLSTQPAKGEVLYGFTSIDGADSDFYVEASLIEQVYQRLAEVENSNVIYWKNV